MSTSKRDRHFSTFPTHYISHVFTAANEYLQNHPERAGTPAYRQMEAIQDAAFNEYDRRTKEDAERIRLDNEHAARLHADFNRPEITPDEGETVNL